MKTILIKSWHGKPINKMSKEELIEALNESHNLWLDARRRGVENMADVAIHMATHRPKSFLQRLFSEL